MKKTLDFELENITINIDLISLCNEKSIVLNLGMLGYTSTTSAISAVLSYLFGGKK